MSNGYSLHFGLNRVSPDHYNGKNGFLYSCVADAKAMATIAENQGFTESKIFLNDQATIDNFEKNMAWLSEQSTAGDLVLLTFSGHGGSIMDRSGDEEDGKDETWLFFDGRILDDIIFCKLKAFKAGVRVVVVADSCHSGSSIRVNGEIEGAKTKKKPLQLDEPQASIILLASCQDPQESLSGIQNSLFTKVLLQKWQQGSYSGNYQSFLEEISLDIPPNRKPNYMEMGTRNLDFIGSRPFVI